MCYGVPGMRKSQSTALAITKQACAQHRPWYSGDLLFILKPSSSCMSSCVIEQKPGGPLLAGQRDGGGPGPSALDQDLREAVEVGLDG